MTAKGAMHMRSEREAGAGEANFNAGNEWVFAQVRSQLHRFLLFFLFLCFLSCPTFLRMERTPTPVSAI